MIFDETKTITLTPEQARIHIVALSVHIERMKRRAERLDAKTAEHRRDRELALALKMQAAKDHRLRMIADTQKELDRMREIFGELKDGKSRN